ncbi:cellulose biosynthesis protein BcsS [Rhodopseudomonas palustris]|nr:cellulose biosynthesis protein BcsS [Rhodopseudomonas palustris]
MRCVEWVRAIGVIAIVIPTPISAVAETARLESAAEADLVNEDDIDPGDLASHDLLESSLEAELGSGLGESLGASLEKSLANSLRAHLAGPELDGGTFASAMASAPSGAAVTSSALLAPFPSATLAGSQAHHVLLFGGYDIWRNGQSAFSGIHWAANGVDNDGFIIRLSLANGVERYHTPRRTYVTDIFRGALMAGWRFKVAEFEVKLLAGPDFEHDNLTPDNSRSPLRGGHPGLRIAGEAWAQPTRGSMLAASFYATTVANGFGIRTAAGWRLIDDFWVGPELIGSRDQFSRQTRLGVHLTGLRSGPVEWSVGWGYVSDSFGRSGGYARLAAQLRP